MNKSRKAAEWAFGKIEITRIVLLILVLAGLAGWLFWAIDWYPRAVIWGDVFTGVAAVGTLATLIFAWRSVHDERQQKKVAVEETNYMRDHHRRRYAEEITWWTEYSEIFPKWEAWDAGGRKQPDDTYNGWSGVDETFSNVHFAEERLEGESPLMLKMHIHNASSQPMRACVVQTSEDNLIPGRRWIGLLPAHSKKTYMEFVIQVYSESKWEGIRAGLMSGQSGIDFLEFQDPTGALWRRNSHGILEQVTSKEPDCGRNYGY